MFSLSDDLFGLSSPTFPGSSLTPTSSMVAAAVDPAVDEFFDVDDWLKNNLGYKKRKLPSTTNNEYRKANQVSYKTKTL